MSCLQFTEHVTLPNAFLILFRSLLLIEKSYFEPVCFFGFFFVWISQPWQSWCNHIICGYAVVGFLKHLINKWWAHRSKVPVSLTMVNIFMHGLKFRLINQDDCCSKNKLTPRLVKFKKRNGLVLGRSVWIQKHLLLPEYIYSWWYFSFFFFFSNQII